MPQLTICIKYVTFSGAKALHFDAYTKKDGTTPFRDFLTTLPAKDRAKLLATITKIEEHGLAEATRQQWAFNSYLFSIFSYLIMIFSFRCMVYWNTWDY